MLSCLSTGQGVYQLENLIIYYIVLLLLYNFMSSINCGVCGVVDSIAVYFCKSKVSLTSKSIIVVLLVRNTGEFSSFIG